MVHVQIQFFTELILRLLLIVIRFDDDGHRIVRFSLGR